MDEYVTLNAVQVVALRANNAFELVEALRVDSLGLVAACTAQRSVLGQQLCYRVFVVGHH